MPKKKNSETTISDMANALSAKLWEQDPMLYIVNFFVDENNNYQLSLVAAKDGRLFKAPISFENKEWVIGELIEVEYNFVPVEPKTLMTVRQIEGQYRWFAMPACTAVMNRMAELDSTELFDSFVSHTLETKEYPYLTFYHFGEVLRMGVADFVAREGFTYIASGLFDQSRLAQEAAKTLMESKDDEWGISIGFMPTVEPDLLNIVQGVEIPVYKKGVNVEISILLEKDAASLFTNVKSKEEIIRMNKKTKEALLKLTGNDTELTEELAARVDGINRSADEKNLIRRDAVPPVETPIIPPVEDPKEVPVVPPLETPVAEIPVVPPVEEVENTLKIDEATLIELAGMLFQTDAFKEAVANAVKEGTASADKTTKESLSELSGQVDLVTEAVKELQKKDEEADEADEDFQKNIPARSKSRIVFRPRIAEVSKTVLDKKIRLADVAVETLTAMPAVKR